MTKKKSLVVNSIYSVIYKLLNVMFPLITATYAARTLLADGVGKVSYAQNIAQYFVIIAALGIPNYGTREIGKNQNNQDKTNEAFSELFIINTCSTLICVIAYYTLILNLDFFSENRILFMTVGLSIVMNLLNVDWFYQGKEEYGYIAARSFVVKVISLIALFVFVRDEKDYIIYALIHCLATAGNYLFNIFNLRGKVKFCLHGISVKKHIKPVMILLASSISIELYTLVDTTMLGTWCSDSIVGYYNNASKLARIINSILSSIALVLLPRLSLYYHDGLIEEFRNIANRVLKILIVLSVPAAVGLFLMADVIVPVLFGSSFMPAVKTVRILSVLVIAVALNNFFGTQILLTVGQEKKLLISVMIGAGVNILLNSVLIRPYLQNGAAVASAISELCVLIATFIFAQKYLRFRLKKEFLLSLVVSVIFMIVAVVGIKCLNLPNVAELILGVGVGASVYLICGWVTHNSSVRDICSIGLNMLCKISKRSKE